MTGPSAMPPAVVGSDMTLVAERMRQTALGVVDGWQALGPVVRPVPRLFASRQGVGRCTQVHLTANAWRLTSAAGVWADCHLACITGPRVAIAMQIAFPSDPSTAPAFVAEAAFVGGRVLVVYFGLQPIGHRTHWSDVISQHYAEALQACWGDWTTEPPAPPWLADYRGPADFFRRDGGLERLELTLQLWRAYGSTYAQLASGRHALPPTNPLLAYAADSAFRQHNATNTPSRRYLQRVFTADWSDRFIDDFLYAPPM